MSKIIEFRPFFYENELKYKKTSLNFPRFISQKWFSTCYDENIFLLINFFQSICLTIINIMEAKECKIFMSSTSHCGVNIVSVFAYINLFINLSTISKKNSFHSSIQSDFD